MAAPPRAAFNRIVTAIDLSEAIIVGARASARKLLPSHTVLFALGPKFQDNPTTRGSAQLNARGMSSIRGSATHRPAMLLPDLAHIKCGQRLANLRDCFGTVSLENGLPKLECLEAFFVIL
jgi:hypothetical protein